MIWLIGILVATGGLTAWALWDENEPTSPIARDPLLASRLRDWFAVADGAMQSEAAGDRNGFLGQVGALYEILADICAMSNSALAQGGVHCEPMGEEVSQGQFGTIYQTALYTPTAVTIPQLIQTATSLVSLGYLYESKLMLDVAVSQV